MIAHLTIPATAWAYEARIETADGGRGSISASTADEAAKMLLAIAESGVHIEDWSEHLVEVETRLGRPTGLRQEAEGWPISEALAEWADIDDECRPLFRGVDWPDALIDGVEATATWIARIEEAEREGWRDGPDYTETEGLTLKDVL